MIQRLVVTENGLTFTFEATLIMDTSSSFPTLIMDVSSVRSPSGPAKKNRYHQKSWMGSFRFTSQIDK